jgi:hypothetical protein
MAALWPRFFRSTITRTRGPRWMRWRVCVLGAVVDEHEFVIDARQGGVDLLLKFHDIVLLIIERDDDGKYRRRRHGRAKRAQKSGGG